MHWTDRILFKQVFLYQEYIQVHHPHPKISVAIPYLTAEEDKNERMIVLQ